MSPLKESLENVALSFIHASPFSCLQVKEEAQS